MVWLKFLIDMDLKQFAEELKLRMEAEIDTISADQPDPLRRTSLVIECVGRYVGELKRYVVKYKFRSVKEEIDFFKHLKPEFLCRLLYFRNLFKIHLFETTNPKESRLRFYGKQLQKIHRCLARHQEFYQYVLSGAGENDESYFSRAGALAKMVAFDERFSTKYDHTLSRIRCADMLRSYMLIEIQRIENPVPEPVTSALTWTGAKTDLVELIYALQASDVFNKGNAGVKQIASQFEIMFNVTLGNCYRTFLEIQQRKNQTHFVDVIKQKLKQRLNDIQ